MSEQSTIATERRTREFSLPVELRWFVGVSVACAIASVLVVVAAMLFSHAPGHGLPLDLRTHEVFMDLYFYLARWDVVHQQAFFEGPWRFVYPPGGVLVYLLFYELRIRHSAHWYAGSLGAMFAMAFATLAFYCVRFSRSLRAEGLRRRDARLLIAMALLTSWPLVYAIHQGNTELLLWMGVAAGLWAYYRRMWWTSAVLLGLFSFKMFPVMFLVLFLRPRKYAQIAVSVAIFLLLAFAGVAYIGPTVPVAYRNIMAGMKYFSGVGLSVEGIAASGSAYEHSLCGLLHVVLRYSPHVLLLVMRVYTPAVMLLFAVLFVARAYRMPRVNQVMFLSLVAVFIPPLSFDYTLQLLYVPWAWLALECVRAAGAGQRIRGMKPAMAGYGLLFAPMLLPRFHHMFLSGPLKAVVIAALFYVCLRYPLSAAAPDAELGTHERVVAEAV